MCKLSAATYHDHAGEESEHHAHPVGIELHEREGRQARLLTVPALLLLRDLHLYAPQADTHNLSEVLSLSL